MNMLLTNSERYDKRKWALSEVIETVFNKTLLMTRKDHEDSKNFTKCCWIF